MNIKVARTEDAPEIRALIIEAVDPERNEDFDEEGRAQFLRATTIESIQRRLGEKNYFTLRYFINGEVAGIISMRNHEIIDQLFVRPESRNMKVATRLWQAARKICAECGNKGRYSTKSSTFAVNVYKSFGFRLEGGRMKEKGIVFYPMVLDENGSTD